MEFAGTEETKSRWTASHYRSASKTLIPGKLTVLRRIRPTKCASKIENSSTAASALRKVVMGEVHGDSTFPRSS
jgi:hypothetical protein